VREPMSEPEAADAPPEPRPPAQAPGPAPGTCANCGATLAGPFCSSCGQKAASGAPLHTRRLLGEAFGTILDVDRPLLHTIVGLSSHPGRVCDEYARGRRAAYTNPFKYALGCTALLVLVATVFGADPLPTLQISTDPQRQHMATEFAQAVRHEVLAHLNIAIFAALPVWALALKIAFRRAKKTYAEHFMFTLFIGGHAALLRTVASPFLIQWPIAGAAVAVGVEWLLALWASSVFYPGGLPGRACRLFLAELVLRTSVMLVAVSVSLFLLVVYPGEWRARFNETFSTPPDAAQADPGPANQTPGG
jgi:hypothetical protein